jgi:hypothetical protein
MQQTAHKSIGTPDNTQNSHEWELHDLTRKLLWWADIFNNAFFKDQPVPAPAISYKKTNLITLGHHVIGKGDFSLKENLSRVHLSRSLWEVLVIVMHEMTHAWQALFGKPSNNWYHNQEFRRKMLECGIACNKAGCHHGVCTADTPMAHGSWLHEDVR